MLVNIGLLHLRHCEECSNFLNSVFLELILKCSLCNLSLAMTIAQMEISHIRQITNHFWVDQIIPFRVQLIIQEVHIQTLHKSSLPSETTKHN